LFTDFEENNFKPEIVSASGAGILVALAALAPKKGNSVKALKSFVDFGIDDRIYQYLPVNFKVFQKPGYLAEMYRDFMTLLFSALGSKDGLNRFLNDWWLLVTAMFSPTDLKADSLGMCEVAPFVSNLIDFNELKNLKQDVFINAYNVTDKKMDIFGKTEITPEHVKAALSYPFIYPPYSLGGKDYYEGAVVDALNYKGLMEKINDIEKIIVFDALGSKDYLTKPRNLYDAWVKSITIPLIETARNDTELFELKHKRPDQTLVKIKFEIPEKYMTEIFDWTHSNLKRLFEIGYDAGIKYLLKA